MSIPATFHDLSGKSVFITGGGSGIGASLTDGFLAQGAKVAFVQRSDASEFCDEMEAKHGVRPLFIPCDITDMTALEAAITHAAQVNGDIEVLVNNAANDKRHAVEEVTEEFWDWMQAINLKAYFFAAQAVVPAMKAAGKGAIINFTSISYMMGNAGYPLYTTANAGLNGMTRSLARDLGGANIRVNALAPGWVLTQKQLDLWADPISLASHLERQCLKEHLVPEDIVGGVLFLASDVSRMMTGQTMVIDGGVVVTG
jgi:NAD(P)-dependent dehydrogenase (short-subunit alcohol dehydrogenase family)